MSVFLVSTPFTDTRWGERFNALRTAPSCLASRHPSLLNASSCAFFLCFLAEFTWRGVQTSWGDSVVCTIRVTVVQCRFFFSSIYSTAKPSAMPGTGEFLLFFFILFFPFLQGKMRELRAARSQPMFCLRQAIRRVSIFSRKKKWKIKIFQSENQTHWKKYLLNGNFILIFFYLKKKRKFLPCIFVRLYEYPCCTTSVFFILFCLFFLLSNLKQKITSKTQRNHWVTIRTTFSVKGSRRSLFIGFNICT